MCHVIVTATATNFYRINSDYQTVDYYNDNQLQCNMLLLYIICHQFIVHHFSVKGLFVLYLFSFLIIIMKFDILEFLKHYEEHPYLWNKTLPDFRN